MPMGAICYARRTVPPTKRPAAVASAVRATALPLVKLRLEERNGLVYFMGFDDD